MTGGVLLRAGDEGHSQKAYEDVLEGVTGAPVASTAAGGQAAGGAMKLTGTLEIVGNKAIIDARSAASGANSGPTAPMGI